MSSGKGRFFRLLSGLMLDSARVEAVEAPAPRFRLIRLADTSTADEALEPGDKLQVLLPGDDVRTYTPIGWSGRRTTLLAWLHGDAPGATWARAVKAGDTLQYLGPQRSLRLSPGRVVLIGDETSVAVAAAFQRARPGQVTAILATDAPDEVAAAARAAGLEGPVLVSPGAPDEGPAAVVEAALGALGRGEATVGLTGGAHLIQAVRAGLRARGVPDPKVKAYWAAGRAGLD